MCWKLASFAKNTTKSAMYTVKNMNVRVAEFVYSKITKPVTR